MNVIWFESGPRRGEYVSIGEENFPAEYRVALPEYRLAGSHSTEGEAFRTYQAIYLPAGTRRLRPGGYEMVYVFRGVTG